MAYFVLASMLFVAHDSKTSAVARELWRKFVICYTLIKILMGNDNYIEKCLARAMGR